MKKILITGSNGFIGKNLINFYEKKYSIIYHTRNTNIFDVLKDKPDLIINAAASIYEESEMFESNVVLVNCLIDYIKKTNTRMVHIGSSSEYGRKNIPTKETDCPSPTTAYEATKSAATMLCVGYAKAYNLEICVARPYSVYGKHEKSYRLFPRLYNSFVNNEPMTLYNGFHDFIYIKDFVRGIDTLLNSEKETIKGDIVNFGSGHQYSNFEIFELFEKQFSHKAPVTINNNMNKNFESDIWVCDPSYAQKKYNFTCEYNITTGISDYIKTMKGNIS